MHDQSDVGLVLPHLSAVAVQHVVSRAGEVLIVASAITGDARCPGCGTASRSVRGRYQRRLADLPIGGLPVHLELQVRRFNCLADTCAARTFVEQIPGLINKRGRRSQSLQQLLHGVGAALAGRAGARLCAKLAMHTSRTTLLRLLRAAPEPPLTTAPRVLGVDDFALRRGQVYATILLDMETRRPVDVLPDREADTLAGWLRAHPGVQIICWDRAGAYADGARAGAPDAIQIADRWHVWHNLGEAVEATVVAHRASLPEPPPEPTPGHDTNRPVQAAGPAAQAASIRPDSLPSKQLGEEIRLVTRTRERYSQIQQLLADGVSRAEVSRRLGLDPQTVRRFADAESVDGLLANTRRDSLLDPFKNHLHQRWNEGCTDTTALHAELRERGYRGSVQTLRRYLRPLRPIQGAVRRHLKAPAAPAPPKPRRVAKWIMTDPAKLTATELAKLAAICHRSPALHALAGYVRDFADMMHKLRGARLPQWIATVLTADLPSLQSFAKGLQRDLTAVVNGLTLPWSSGAVEGHVNRVKMLKRQMYGRAKFDLLRRRILQPN